MYTFKYGGKRGKSIELKESTDKIVVRTKGNVKLQGFMLGKSGKEVMDNTNEVLSFPEAGISVRQVDALTDADALVKRDVARETMKNEEDVRFAGRVLEDTTSGEVMLYTENFFIKFRAGTPDATCLQLLTKYQLSVKMALPFAEKSWFVQAPEGTGLKTFEIAEAVLKEKIVEFCHPEMVQERRTKSIGAMQWHLAPTNINGIAIEAHIDIASAWKVTKGKGTVIAIIDDGVDIDHPEFVGRIVHPRDVTLSTDDPRPKEKDDNHGTPCAGVALASGLQASGTAPEAALMPIRLRNGLGSMAEAQAFAWAADHGADIISCSWGPADGRWWDPMDPAHTRNSFLPDSTRLAIDYAMTKGRNGKGCVVLFAAGNGNEGTENDGYVSYPPVIAVGACNDTNKRSIYSDFGKAVHVSFPSRDFGWKPMQHPNPLTPGIYTTDRMGVDGYQSTNYHEAFSGTSSACPGVAGVIGLMLAANPGLTPTQVKEIIRTTSTKIDQAGGEYDAQGHSIYYGYGRIHAGNAVAAAQKMLQTTSGAAAVTNLTGIIAGIVRFAKAGDLVFRDSTVYKPAARDKILGVQLTVLPKGLSLKSELSYAKTGLVSDQKGNYIGTSDATQSLIGIGFTLSGKEAEAYELILEAGGSRGSKKMAKNGEFIGSRTQKGAVIQWFSLKIKPRLVL
jgi:subtilisin family serine protease